MQILKIVATLLSLSIAGLGLLGVVAPEALLAFARPLLTPPALYAVALVRVAFGALLIAVASASRAPGTLRWLGGFIVVAGLLTPFFGAERFAEMTTSLSERLSLLRTVAFAALLVGLLLAYALNPSRKVPG
jgi:uncharacterized membrane protein YidH (DUF202 family)